MAELDILGLRTFVAICEKHSVTEAARSLGMTQSAVSQRLRRLEDQSRFQLFDRSLRPMALTSAGQILLQRAKAILTDIDHLEFELSGRGELPIPELRLGVADSLGYTLVPALVREIKQTVNRLTVRVDGSADLCRLLIQRDVHAIVSSDPLLDRQDLDRFTIHTEPLMLVAPITPGALDEDLRGVLTHLSRTMPMLRYTAGTPFAQQIELLIRRLSLSPPLEMEFNDSETIVEMVRQGLGWTITTPICLIQSRVALDNVIVRKLPFGDTERSFHLLSRKSELGPLAGRLAKAASKIIHNHVTRRTPAQAPWAEVHH
jgi:DNA-binding transcriptional LysR family regulator